MAGLQLNDIKKSFGHHAILHGIDLDVGEGEFVVLVGPSGCGKSTLLRLIAGLESASSGQIIIDNDDVTTAPPGDRGIAMVFQSYALYPHMTVAKNLSFGLENLKMNRAEIDQRVMEAARMLAIEPLLDRRPKQLSGGQRQRVAIGRAIVRNPKLFLFDEPLSNLDAALRVQTRGEISRLHKRLGATMVYVTHDQIEAMTMADRIVVLNAGRVEQIGTPLELFAAPANKFVAGFIGSPQMNFFEGTLLCSGPGGVAVEVPGFEVVNLPVEAANAVPGQAVILGVRPSHFELVKDGGANGLAVRFNVDYAESIGTDTYVYGKLEGSETATIAHLSDHVAVEDQSSLSLAVQPQRVHLFDSESSVNLNRATFAG
ncbi:MULTISPECIES: ABC transporter ATP-binding protein [Rhizobium]|uniref:Maltose/maltodextrin import ATP-binding protein MalK n=1 Tax=Rhizobium favelukesii TaxID=348824 RepID=W6RLY0_9HYPH|nr:MULTISPECIES: sn-glycerol-3-phosphate ABC transporter ATP-binding protein UgpC [Rhizobium]MCS0461949.1 sn-glycerol-3-phosphate ABC transporter ATP-binding protein UgpC [Rhizobium favelukesii]UFS80321.1 sn-glycerol-3-phosphate ABC transporter ATP-binding protein UgpC [Rhizobium sp. T136]CDM62132.1 Maltose/maltodextrin import ATP-binding protein MalK [Rhizobium favelukesii]